MPQIPSDPSYDPSIHLSPKEVTSLSLSISLNPSLPLFLSLASPPPPPYTPDSSLALIHFSQGWVRFDIDGRSLYGDPGLSSLLLFLLFPFSPLPCYPSLPIFSLLLPPSPPYRSISFSCPSCPSSPSFSPLLTHSLLTIDCVMDNSKYFNTVFSSSLKEGIEKTLSISDEWSFERTSLPPPPSLFDYSTLTRQNSSCSFNSFTTVLLSTQTHSDSSPLFRRSRIFSSSLFPTPPRLSFRTVKKF